MFWGLWAWPGKSGCLPACLFVCLPLTSPSFKVWLVQTEMSTSQNTPQICEFKESSWLVFRELWARAAKSFWCLPACLSVCLSVCHKPMLLAEFFIRQHTLVLHSSISWKRYLVESVFPIFRKDMKEFFLGLILVASSGIFYSEFCIFQHIFLYSFRWIRCDTNLLKAWGRWLFFLINS